MPPRRRVPRLQPRKQPRQRSRRRVWRRPGGGREAPAPPEASTSGQAEKGAAPPFRCCSVHSAGVHEQTRQRQRHRQNRQARPCTAAGGMRPGSNLWGRQKNWCAAADSRDGGRWRGPPGQGPQDQGPQDQGPGWQTSSSPSHPGRWQRCGRWRSSCGRGAQRHV